MNKSKGPNMYTGPKPWRLIPIPIPSRIGIIPESIPIPESCITGADSYITD